MVGGVTDHTALTLPQLRRATAARKQLTSYDGYTQVAAPSLYDAVDALKAIAAHVAPRASYPDDADVLFLMFVDGSNTGVGAVLIGIDTSTGTRAITSCTRIVFRQ